MSPADGLVRAGRSSIVRRRAAPALAAVAALLALAGLAAPAAAQESDTARFEGQPVTAVEVHGLHNLSQETLLYYLDLAPGQELHSAALNARIKNLWERELIDDITVRYEPAEGGVKVVIDVKERPILRSVDYEGLKKLSRTDIQDKIVEERISVHEGAPLSRGELSRLEAAIEELYANKGYRFADVRYELQDAGANEVRAVFTVDEGDRVRISDIDFEGNTVFSDLRLRLAMRKTKESGLITRLLRKDIYNPGKLEEDLEKVRELYEKKGYKNVVLGDPETDIVEHGDKRRMELTIPVEEGERFRFGEISIEGNKVYSDQALLRVFHNKPGGWLKKNQIDEGLESIKDLYSNTGYMFARVEPEIVERDDNVADVIIHVSEGDQYRVGRIEFKGNSRTMDKVLRRELRVQEGYVMNVSALRNSVYKVNQLGYFKLDEDDPVQIDVDQDAKTVDLVFVGEEADRTELQFGGGWSEFEGFFGQFSIRTQNFLGRGESVQASFQSGVIQDYFDLGYFVPWFLDRPQTVGLQVFSRNLNYDYFNNNEQYQYTQQGVTATYGRSFRLFQSFSVGYTRARYTERAVFVDPTTGDPTKISRPSIDSSSLRPSWAYNSIDNSLEPTRGTRLAISSEYSGGVLGGADNYIKPEVGFTAYRPLGGYPVRHVVGLNLEGGYLHPLSGGVTSSFRFYRLGGERSIRGFNTLSIIPRDDNGNPFRDQFGYIIGGDKYLQANAEYQFLAGGPFRVVLFSDAGNTWGRGENVDLNSLYWTGGIELRILVPVFGAPLRFIYSFNLGPEPPAGQSFENFQFSIGTTF